MSSTSSGGRPRPLTHAGVVDTAALHVIEALSALEALASAEVAIHRKRWSLIRGLHASIDCIDGSLRSLR